MRDWLARTYGRRTWRELLYLLLALMLGVLDLWSALAIALAALLSLVTLGLPVLSACVIGARMLGRVHLTLLEKLLGTRIHPPGPVHTRSGRFGWVRGGLADVAGWRAAGYLALRLPLSVAQFVVGGTCWWYGVYFAVYPILWVVGSWLGSARASPIAIAGASFDTLPRAVALGGLGMALLVAAPAATRLVLFIEAPVARGLLGQSTRQRLQRSRAQAVESSAAELRRIERDLHDGPQAQLVAIALKLGLAKEELAAGDSQAAMDLVDTAHEGAKAALTELRDLVRGIHPPVLGDGLGPALETLAARSGLVVEVMVEFRQRASPAIETVAYFCAAELITNVAKHSGATGASLRVTSLPRDRFRLTVSDDGIGGAQTGGGLSGLAARVDAVDGALMIHSPPGGPTVVQVDLPMQA